MTWEASPEPRANRMGGGTIVVWLAERVLSEHEGEEASRSSSTPEIWFELISEVRVRREDCGIPMWSPI